MTSDFLVTVAIIAAAISAVAIVAMAIMAVRMFNAVTTIRDQARFFLSKADNLVKMATKTIAENQKQVGDIISRAPEIVATTHNVVTRLDDFVDDVSVRAKTQLDRLELVRDDAMERIHHSAEMIDTVLTPVRGVSEAADGVRAMAKLLNRQMQRTSRRRIEVRRKLKLPHLT